MEHSSPRDRPAAANQRLSPVARWRHLVGRFFGVLGAKVEPARLAILDELLQPAERTLFLSMSVADQRHSLDLWVRLRNDGERDPDLLGAALLHDVGKATGRIPLAYRVAFTLCLSISRGLATWLARSEGPAWRWPFFLAAHHPRLGAEAAARAGSNATVVRLIAGHSDPGTDALSRTLYHYDRSM